MLCHVIFVEANQANVKSVSHTKILVSVLYTLTKLLISTLSVGRQKLRHISLMPFIEVR